MKEKILRVLKISFGNIIEWYDFCLYGYFADTIAQQFFPDSNHFIALLATFGAFGVGFVARPLGGILFGHLGDKIGRYFAMNLAIIFMSIPTMAMALLPTYNIIGIYAPIALVLIRIIQGLSAGGQYSNLLTITTEEEDFRFKGFHNGIAYSVSVIGFVFAAVVSYIAITFLPQSMQSYAWRIPFALSVVLLICQLILRGDEHKKELKEFNLEIPHNEQVQKEKIPLVLLLTKYKRSAISIILLSTVTSSLYYLVITYFVTFTVDIEKLPMSDALVINAVSLICLCICVPIFGLISDFIGRKLILLFSFAVFLADITGFFRG
jgi:MFS transporter, MHS family, proline/betaine transporter